MAKKASAADELAALEERQDSLNADLEKLVAEQRKVDAKYKADLDAFMEAEKDFQSQLAAVADQLPDAHRAEQEERLAEG